MSLLPGIVTFTPNCHFCPTPALCHFARFLLFARFLASQSGSWLPRAGSGFPEWQRCPKEWQRCGNSVPRGGNSVPRGGNGVPGVATVSQEWQRYLRCTRAGVVGGVYQAQVVLPAVHPPYTTVLHRHRIVTRLASTPPGLPEVP